MTVITGTDKLVSRPSWGPRAKKLVSQARRKPEKPDNLVISSPNNIYTQTKANYRYFLLPFNTSYAGFSSTIQAMFASNALISKLFVLLKNSVTLLDKELFGWFWDYMDHNVLDESADVLARKRWRSDNFIKYIILSFYVSVPSNGPFYWRYTVYKIAIFITWENNRHIATSPLVSCEMTSEERVQKFHTDDVSLPRSG